MTHISGGSGIDWPVNALLRRDRKGGRAMPEEERRETGSAAGEKEDVDDLIFHTEPEWCASQR